MVTSAQRTAQRDYFSLIEPENIAKEKEDTDTKEEFTDWLTHRADDATMW